MPRRSEQTVAYRVYHQGKDLLGIASIEMPNVQYMNETLSGSGIAGEIDNPTIGITQSLTCKLTFTAVNQEVFYILDWSKTALYECYLALQTSDDATSIRDSIPERINMLGRTKTFNFGSREQGKKHGNEVELELTRFEAYLENQEKLLIDKLNFIHRVNGTDLLQKVRAQTGLNI